MNREQQTYREVCDALHASAQTRREVLNVTQRNETKRSAGRRALTLALAAALVLALAAGALAANGVFRMRIREAAPEERFAGPTGSDLNGDPLTYYWEGAKLVFNFEGPEDCYKIRFKPGYLPYNGYSYFSPKDADGWYSRLSCEGRNGGSEQPCLIEVRYAPMFLSGGNLLLLYADNVTEIEEEEWSGCRVTKFQTKYENPNFPEERDVVDGSYYILYQPEQGYIITVSSMQDNLDELEQIAKSLQIEQTDEIVSAADYQGHNEFLDSGVG